MFDINNLDSKELIDLRNKIDLTVDGEDIFIKFHFKKGAKFIIDTFDNNLIDVDEYNEEQYDQLYIESLNRADGLHNFYIPLYCDFVATDDVNILKDEIDVELDYENILFVIRMDTIDYIFTEDIEFCRELI